MDSSLILRAERVQKIYKKQDAELPVLKGLDLTVNAGEALCIMGPSGAGKSTFLHILGTLDRPTLGAVYFEGEDLSRKSDEELARFRQECVGFVFQFHHLLTEFNALENVALPLRIAGVGKKHARRRAEDLLSLLGLTERKNHYPSEMSGGEQQRVAVARALVHRPRILMADEPTGNLDMVNSQSIQELFFSLKDELGLTLIVVTHDKSFAERFPRVLTMKDGQWA